MKVDIGKGLSMDIPDDMPTNVEAHARYIGYRNILMDSHASATKDEHGEDYVNVARAMAEKKLAALVAGEVRVSGTRTSDPVAREVRRIATNIVITKLSVKTRKGVLTIDMGAAATLATHIGFEGAISNDVELFVKTVTEWFMAQDTVQAKARKQVAEEAELANLV